MNSALTELLITGAWTGFLATLAMTFFMMIGKKTGMAPLDMPLMMGRQMLGKKAAEAGAAKAGMLMHLAMGTGIGILYQITIANGWGFTEFSLQSATAFALIFWLIMMLFTMPMMGVGLFGMKKSPKVAILTFILHLIYAGTLNYLITL